MDGKESDFVYLFLTWNERVYETVVSLPLTVSGPILGTCSSVLVVSHFLGPKVRSRRSEILDKQGNKKKDHPHKETKFKLGMNVGHPLDRKNEGHDEFPVEERDGIGVAGRGEGGWGLRV